MLNEYALRMEQLRAAPKRWTITGVAGFIGSNLLEALLALDQEVSGLDNFATGHAHNLDSVKSRVTSAQWERFIFHEGDICSLDACQNACKGAHIVLHHAALGSVPRSIEDPIRTNTTNIGGFLHMLTAARDAHVERFVYAASSSTYGDHPGLPKVEERIGKPLSPYAVTKYVNELYADVFATIYGIEVIGLRYFNVFGPRQDPMGAYAAVIPKWIAAMKNEKQITINGDGETSRDFCYIANVIQANVLAGTTPTREAINQIYNVALGDRTSLTQLHRLISQNFTRHGIPQNSAPEYLPFRAGDVRHSQADISKAQRLLGYAPHYKIEAGIAKTVDWYLQNK